MTMDGMTYVHIHNMCAAEEREEHYEAKTGVRMDYTDCFYQITITVF